MAPPRFLLERLPAAGETAWLDRDEARHALGSRRLTAGDSVELVDGRGAIATATLGSDRNADGNPGAVVMSVQRVPRAVPAVHVATALPKGDRLSTLLDAIGELAVESITPLHCNRSVTPADKLAGERTTRILTEAMKQSRGAWLTEVRPAMSPAEFARASLEAGRCTVVLDPRGRPLQPLTAGSTSVAMLAGPEGGFSELELRELHELGVAPASLGGTVLRVELAVAVACGVIRASMAD